MLILLQARRGKSRTCRILRVGDGSSAGDCFCIRQHLALLIVALCCFVCGGPSSAVIDCSHGTRSQTSCALTTSQLALTTACVGATMQRGRVRALQVLDGPVGLRALPDLHSPKYLSFGFSEGSLENWGSDEAAIKVVGSPGAECKPTWPTPHSDPKEHRCARLYAVVLLFPLARTVTSTWTHN